MKLSKDRIQLVERVADWKEAIRKASKPLLDDGSIEASYVEAMIDSVIELGPYIVIDEGLAMPHARPESGVNRGGVAFLKCNEAVDFCGNAVNLIFVLAAEDNEKHLQRLAKMMDLFSDEERMQALRRGLHLSDMREVLEGVGQ